FTPLSSLCPYTTLFRSVTAEEGIAALDDAATSVAAVGGEGDTERLFDFPNWRQGGLASLNKNKRVLEQRAAAAQTPGDRAAELRSEEHTSELQSREKHV